MAEPGAAEPGAAEALAAEALEIAGSLEGELATLEAALGRLEDGTYGRCEACGATIDEALVEAEPATTRCRAHRPPDSGTA